MNRLIIALFTVICVSFPAQAILVTGSTYGYNSNFINNGLVTTEIRSDGTRWEWLDLTVTNGIRFESIQADLDDDGSLNNSISGGLDVANKNALQDITSLQSHLSMGWTTVNNLHLSNLINSFFGASLDGTIIGAVLPANTLPSTTPIKLKRDFVQLFGSTLTDGIRESGTNTWAYSPMTEFETIGVSNDFIVSLPDVFTGTIISSYSSRLGYIVRGANHGTATFLTRQVSVSEPLSFSLIFMGLIFILHFKRSI